jgi:hypothetical protein
MPIQSSTWRKDAGSGDPARHLGAGRGGLPHLPARARRAEHGRERGTIPVSAVHAVAGLRMPIGGAVAVSFGVIAILASLSG